MGLSSTSCHFSQILANALLKNIYDCKYMPTCTIQETKMSYQGKPTKLLMLHMNVAYSYCNYCIEIV